MGLFKKAKRVVKKVTKPIAKVLDKVVPNEIKPFLPYAAAAFPFLAPGAFGTLSATMPGFGIQNAFFRKALQRGLTGSGLNIFSQLAQEGSEGDVNLTRAAIAGIPAALATPGLETSLAGDAALTRITAADPTAFGTQLKSGSLDLLSKAAGAAEKGASADLFSMGKAKALATPLSLEGTFDAVEFAKQAEADYLAELAEFNRMAGEQQEASDADRRAAIIASMTRAKFTQDIIDETLDQLGLKDGGVVKMKEGGIMDLDGKEMDMRTGGFIPIGAKERADDVPARLSKNEFVMTADAVRAAGGGSVNKGAKRMYNLMHKLEARA